MSHHVILYMLVRVELHYPTHVMTLDILLFLSSSLLFSPSAHQHKDCDVMDAVGLCCYKNVYTGNPLRELQSTKPGCFFPFPLRIQLHVGIRRQTDRPTHTYTHIDKHSSTQAQTDTHLHTHTNTHLFTLLKRNLITLCELKKSHHYRI